MTDLITTSDFYDGIVETILKELVKYTPQLFFVKDHNSKLPPYADSSAVLLTIDGRFFLLTAGHTVHNIDINHIGIMIGNEFCTIGGHLKYFDPNDSNYYEPNNLDIAIFEIDHASVGAIKEKYDFLQSSKIGLNHLSIGPSRYLIFGYPEKETKKYFPKKQILPDPFIFRTVGVSKNHYSENRIDANRTLVLLVNQKSVMRSKTQLIEELSELGGISGCGVWEVSNLFGDSPQYQLVSILTGENEEKSVLYSTKISVVANLLRIHFNLSIQ
jgi:hypothetical protein